MSKNKKTRDVFNAIAQASARFLGSASALFLACLVVIVWAVTGPIFQFSDTWQLVINTGTSIATFLMVFLIQNTQNRDSRALHLKLDELIRGVAEARTGLVNLEEMPEEDLERLTKEFKKLQCRPATGKLNPR
jgi:low affinity Fe/Cu permease